MTQEANNHSYFYDSNIIITDTTLPDWKRNYWQVDATDGNIVLSIEAASPSNIVQPGTIIIERLDSVRENTVTLQIDSSGTMLSYDIPAYFRTFFYIFTCCANPNGTADILQQIAVPYVSVPITGGLMEGTIDSSSFVIKAKSPVNRGITSLEVVNYKTLWQSVRLVGDVVSDVNTATDVNTSTVMTVGGKTSVQIAQSVTDTIAATNSNTVSTLGKRDSSGNFSGNTVNLQAVGNSKAVITDGSGNLVGSSVSSTTLAFLDATGSVQTQLDSKTPIVQNQKTVKVAVSSVISLSGLQTIDGVSLVAGDEVLQAQTSAIVNNGIWVVASGAWTRSTQLPTGSDASKAKIFVLQGTLNAGTIWTCTNATGSLVGTASLAISILTPAVSSLYTNLTAAITNSATTLSVASTNGFPSTGIVMILNESIKYTGKTSNTLTGCIRGSNGSTAAAAVINAYVNFVTEEIPYYPMGADFTVSTNPQRVYRSHMWMSGAASAVRTWTPAQIPWVYADITAAVLACIFWLQEITTFFKGLENDMQWDQLIGALPASIVSKITGNVQIPDASSDMDNATAIGGTAYASEWFEFIVGRNAAGTELYTMSFTVALTSTNATVTSDTLYPFRIIWQTTRGAGMAGFNAQTLAAVSASLPKCTAYGTGGVTIPASGYPIWAIPVSIETTF